MLRKSFVLQQRIIEAALDFVRKTGSLTLKDIEQIAGCNIAAVNYHFKDKSSFNKILLNKVFDEGLDTSNIDKDSTDVNVVVAGLVESTMKFVERNVGVLKYIINSRETAPDLVMPGEKSVIVTFVERYNVLLASICKLLSPVMPQFTEQDIHTRFTAIFSGYIVPCILQLENRDSDIILQNDYIKNRDVYAQCFKNTLLS